MHSFLITRICLVGVSAVGIFIMSRMQAREKLASQPRKSVLLGTKVLNLIFAALIAICVVGQLIDLISRR